MQFARPQFDPHFPSGPGRGKGGKAGQTNASEPPEPGTPDAYVAPTNRLNLLLSCPSWQPASWTEHLPRLLSPQGVTAHWAPSARQAEQLIRQTPVHIAVVDLRVPLDDSRLAPGEHAPQEGGPRILQLLSRLACPPPTVVIQSPRTARDDARHLNAALRCGAFAVVDRTAADLELMLAVMQRVLARFYQDRWPHIPPNIV